MSIRIDGQSPQPDAGAARRVESKVSAERGPAAAGGRADASDRVDVSSDAQLVASAMQAAQDAPDVRPDAVERGRRAMERSLSPADADRLADRIISSLLGE